MSSTTLARPVSSGLGRKKFLIGGMVIIAAVVYLVVSSTATGAQFFFTVDELTADASAVGKPARVAGAVLGDSIQYDPETLTLTFTIVHMPADQALVNDEGGLAEALHQAVLDESRTRLQVVYIGVRPDLLKDEAQAIVSGQLGADGVFHANELLLRCPTRYEQAVPGQVNG